MSRLVGVYHAEGTLLGELRYAWGKLRGTAHCALCDITHGGLREKVGFSAWRETAPLPFQALHLDEQDPVLATFTRDRTPCVVLRDGDELTLVLDAAALDRCAGSVRAFDQALREALRGRP